MPLVDPVTMSSTLLKPSEADAKPKALIQPVPIHDTAVAQSISIGRPVLLLALLAARFHSLVDGPVSELQASLPVVAVVQAAYAVLCLPAAGSQGVKSVKKSRPGEKKKAEPMSLNPVVTTVLALLLTAIATAPVYLLFILFGAPFLDYTAQTLLCAAHFSLLALFPTFYARGTDRQALLAVAGVYAPIDETFGALLGAGLGAWLGAVPIPLDWDREWQKWPVTIVAGVYLGSCLGSKVVGFVFYGKRMGLSEDKSS